jgi:hypothetical protein
VGPRVSVMTIVTIMLIADFAKGRLRVSTVACVVPNRPTEHGNGRVWGVMHECDDMRAV